MERLPVLVTTGMIRAAIKTVSCRRIQTIIGVVQGETGRSFLMAKKPTYEEPEQKVTELENQAPKPMWAQEAVQKSEEHLRLLADALPVLISYVDSEQRYRFNSKTYETWFGRSREEVCGKTVQEVVGGQAYESIRRHIDEALSGREVNFESQVPYKDAGTRCVEATYVPHFGDQGEVQGFYALIRDITERSEADKAFWESEVKYRHLFESLQEGIWGIDRDGHTTFVNPCRHTRGFTAN